MRQSVTYALFAALTAMGAAPALAQSVPEGQSCGGLLCDMGVFGHKTAPAATPPAVTPTPGPQAGRHAEAVPPAESNEPAEPRKHVVRKKRIAKTTPAPAVAVSRPAAVAAAPIHAKPVQAVQATPAQAVPVPPQASAASVTMNPFVQTGPAAAQFRPLY